MTFQSTRLSLAVITLLGLTGCPWGTQNVRQDPKEQTSAGTVPLIEAPRSPWLLVEYDRRKEAVERAGQELEVTLDSAKPRPKIVRFKERAPQGIVASMVEAANETPRYANADALLRSAIMRISVAVNPIFSRAEFGIELVDGPYPEELHYLYALARLKELEGGLSSREALAIENLAIMLESRSDISYEDWLSSIKQRRASVSFSGDDKGKVIHEKEKVTYKPDPDYKGPKGSGGNAGSDEGAKPAGGGSSENQGSKGSGSGSTRPGRPEYGPQDRERPSGSSGGSPNTHGAGSGGSSAGANQTRSEPVVRQPVATREQLEALGKMTVELHQKMVAVRAANKPRPTIYVPRKHIDTEEESPDWEDRNLEKILKKVGRFAPQATTFLSTLFDSEEISVSSETTAVPGPYPEEVAYEASLNKLAAEILRSDLMAKDKVDRLVDELLIEPKPEWRENR